MRKQVRPLRNLENIVDKSRNDREKTNEGLWKNCWRNRLLRSTDPCSQRLIERCSWPQCNHLCPKLQNPLTGMYRKQVYHFHSSLCQFSLLMEARGEDFWFPKNYNRDLMNTRSHVSLNHYIDQVEFFSSGEELDLLELLQSFGLDMKNVASALGVDIHTLNNMGQRELISLLTQRVE
jgi:hypothetical protein